MQKITTFLWFDNQAEEAAKFYVSLFKDSKIVTMARYGDAGPGPKGSVMTVAFRLQGQDFLALNGGPQFPFTQAISLMVNCETQQEIDDFWERLSAGGEKNVCGWLKDRYGLYWQVVPTAISEMLSETDPAKTNRMMAALTQMTKLDVKKLKEAYAGG